jgi:molybdenum cofactor cytidylyltransferase
MGSAKASLPFRGSTFVEAIAESCDRLRLDPRVIVVGSKGDNILSYNALSGFVVTTNSDHELGPIGSISSGVLAIVNHPVDGALVWAVDQPHVALSTVSLLIQRFRETGADAVLPKYGGRTGHPLLISHRLFADVTRAAAGRRTLRSVIWGNGKRVMTASVDDAAVLEDVDTPEEYDAMIRRYGIV